MECACTSGTLFGSNVTYPHPRCPVHGAGFLDSSSATREELKSLVREGLTEIMLSPGHYTFAIPNSEIDSIASKLLSRYEIRRKQQ